MSSGSLSSTQSHLFVGYALVVLLVGGVGGWAATAEISGAVIAPGSVVVASNVKKVQHPSGGVIGEILARDGDKVDAGQVVVRLDPTIAAANLAVVEKRLAELSLRRVRLLAERDGLDELKVPDRVRDSADRTLIAKVLASEDGLFRSRKEARLGQKSQLRQRIVQLQNEITGLTAQAVAKAGENYLVRRELEGVRKLWDKNLVSITKLTAMEREATRIGGEEAQLRAAAARAKGQIAETELKIIQIDRDLEAAVSRELSDIDGQLGELVERKTAAEDQLKRIDIRAPQSGIVHQSAVHTVGGVITAGDTIMLVVPKADELAIEARVNPQDIDQLVPGQPAMLRFSAFNQRTTPEIEGQLSRISADLAIDQRSGERHYTARISISPDQLARLGSVPLVPGMPVEVFFRTGDRRVITYLVKPLSDQITRAFREE